MTIGELLVFYYLNYLDLFDNFIIINYAFTIRCKYSSLKKTLDANETTVNIFE